MARREYPKLPDAPCWTAAQLETLDAYLTAVIQQTNRAYAAASYAARMADDCGFGQNAAYWKNARSAIRWVRGQLRRQAGKKRPKKAVTHGESP
jgi:hypothetical protein